MPPCSMVRCAEEGGEEEEGKTALIDQRAVAGGKNHYSQAITIIATTHFMFYKGWSIRVDIQIWQKIKGYGPCPLEKLRVARQLCLGTEYKDIHSSHVNVG